MSSTEQGLDEERQGKAREYARIRRTLFFINLALGLVVLLGLLMSGLSGTLRDFAAGIQPSLWSTVAIYAAILAAGYTVLTLPLDYYSGFYLPHRFGLSVQGMGSWFVDQAKGMAIGGIVGLAMLELVYTLLSANPVWWWVYVAVVVIAFTVLMTYLAPVVIAPLFHHYSPIQDLDLKSKLIDMAKRTGTQVRGVFTVDMSRKSTAANAWLSGTGNTRRIVLTDTLLDRYTDEEIEVVLAHELGHHVHHDILTGTIVESIATVVGLGIASAVLTWGVGAFGLHGISDVAALPLLALVLAFFSVILLPAGNLYSRWAETRADEFAIRMTGMPRAFTSLMAKLADQNLAEAEPPGWAKVLFYSHPTPAERLRHGRLAEQQSLAD